MNTLSQPDLQSAVPDRKAARRYGRRRLLALCALLAGVGIAWFVIQWSRPTETALPAGVDRADFETARAEFEARYRRTADEIDVFSWLAEKSVKDHKLETALACFEQIPTAHPLYGRSARHQQGNVLMLLNRAAEAETQLREFIALERRDPRAPRDRLADAIRRLRYLLEVQLRFEERRALIAEMVLVERGDVFDTIYYCFPSLLRWNGPAAVERLEKFWRADPENLKLRIALGRYRTGQGRLDEAAEILARCRRDAPRNLAAAAAELALHRERGDWGRIAAELSKLPPASPSDPWLLLLIRGHSYNREKKFRKAVLCFQHVLQSDPANPECCLGLAAAYRGLKMPAQRTRMLTKAQTLARIQNRLGWGQTSPKEIQPFIEIAEQCEQIELFEQAYLMTRLAQRIAPKDPVLQQMIARLTAKRRASR